MASERAKADEENLRQTAFEKGEWANQPPTDLDVDYDLLSGALGTPGSPLMSITAETLLALSFCVDELAQALSEKIDDVLTRWESALTSRIGSPPATGAAADNARTAAETAATCDLERMAVRLVEAKSGVMELVRGVRELPLANGGGMNVRSFPRLMRLADRHGVVETARLRVLATRLGISLPPDHDNSPEARAKWVWQLATLERSVTIRALGWLRDTVDFDAYQAAVTELEPSGRFSVQWMTDARASKRAAAAAAQAAAAAGTGFLPTITVTDVMDRLTAPITSAAMGSDTAYKGFLRQMAVTTQRVHGMDLQGASVITWKNAGGLAFLSAMRERNHGLDKLPVLPADQERAITAGLGYLFPLESLSRSAGASASAPAPADAGGGPASGQSSVGSSVSDGREGKVAFDEESLRALRNLAQATVKPKDDQIVLGKATSDDGTLRRPEYFSVGDVAVFAKYESEYEKLTEVPKADDEAFTAAVRALPDAARDLLSVTVFPADLARNRRLHVLKVLHERALTVADNIIIKGTVLSNERETDEQRAEDRERAVALNHAKRGDLIKGGPHICVVTHRLDSVWTFLQVPYRVNATAAALNGSWDTTWFTWSKAVETFLGTDCEIVEGVKRIVSKVRVQAIKGHLPWPDQTRADYPTVALWLFTRDYRAYREGNAGATKPSLVKILQSPDFLLYLGNSLDYGFKPYMRPQRPPYTLMVLGSATPVKRRPAMSIADMEALDDDDDDDADEGGGPKRTKAQKEKERRERKKLKKKEAAAKKLADDAGGGKVKGDAGGGSSGGGGDATTTSVGSETGKGKGSDQKPEWKNITTGGVGLA